MYNKMNSNQLEKETDEAVMQANKQSAILRNFVDKKNQLMKESICYN